MILNTDLGSLRLAQHAIQFGNAGVLQVRPAFQEIGGGAFRRIQCFHLRRSRLRLDRPDLLIEAAGVAIDAAEGASGDGGARNPAGAPTKAVSFF